jgi:hypothetical protein
VRLDDEAALHSIEVLHDGADWCIRHSRAASETVSPALAGRRGLRNSSQNGAQVPQIAAPETTRAGCTRMSAPSKVAP